MVFGSGFCWPCADVVGGGEFPVRIRIWLLREISDGWAGFTSTTVPMFAGRTSWDQYRQVFEAIVSYNGWDDVTAALQP